MVLNDNQRRLRKSKQSERDLGHYLLAHNGKDTGTLGTLATNTGRVGHLTELQFDVVSDTYAAENKNVKVPKKILGWWDQIVTIAAKHGKQPLLRIVPTNDEKRYPEMHIITAERHAELLDIEFRMQGLLK